MKYMFAGFFALLTVWSAQAQKAVYFTKSANVAFDCTAKKSPEEIKAKQTSGTFVINEAGVVEASILVKSFLFKSALMQEHFNENYLESDKYPKAIFKGNIKEGAVNFTQDGTYNITVEGNLTMHGVTKTIKTPAKVTVKSGKVSAEADFTLPLADYAIAIPTLVADKVAKDVKITIKGDLAKK